VQNTGTWNSDEAIFYFLVVISPICLYFLAGFIRAVFSMMPDSPEQEISFTRLVGEEEAWQAVKDRCLEDAINGDYRARDWLTKNCYGSAFLTPEPKPKPQVQPKKQETTSPEIVDEAIAGLAGLGYKKSEARRLVNKLAASKVYKKSEDLLTEIISAA
jgi:hypothetical protein|tara:strand:+ start:552 stop:1028 length:477 start_codon:yes stop_codon:yes gene_type:complete